MYYYIFEPPRSSHERAYFEKIRGIARQFSISGEITQSSPARSPEELVDMAITKNYTTIVAVGSDNHINKIASQIIKKSDDFPMAIGIIPTNPDSMLYEKWGTKSAEDACETLKFRKLEKFDVGLVDPDIYFLTSIEVEPRRPTRIYLSVDHWKAEGVFNRIEISSNLFILVERYLKEKSFIKSSLNWLLGKGTTQTDISIFKGRTININAIEPVDVKIGNEVVTKTPINIYKKPRAISIITPRTPQTP